MLKLMSLYVAVILIIIGGIRNGVEGDQGLQKTTGVCASETVVLNCNPGEIIRVTQAFYGLSQYGEQYCAYKPGDTCKEPTMDVDLDCTGRKETCSYDTSGKSHRKCGGHANYLTVDYECMPVDGLKNICSSISVEDRSGYITSPNFPDTMSGIPLECKCSITSLLPDREIVVSEVYGGYRYFPSDNCDERPDAVELSSKDKSRTVCKPEAQELMTAYGTINVTLYHREGPIGGKIWLSYESPGQDGRVLVRCGEQVEQPLPTSPPQNQFTTDQATTESTTVTTAAPTTTQIQMNTAADQNTTDTTSAKPNSSTTIETTNQTAAITTTTASSETTSAEKEETGSENSTTSQLPVQTASTTTEEGLETTSEANTETITTSDILGNLTDSDVISQNSSKANTTSQPESGSAPSHAVISAVVFGAVIAVIAVAFLVVITLVVIYFRRNYTPK